MSLYSVKVSLKLRAGVAQRPIFAIQAVHKQIYAVIAKEYDLQPRSVESNIRTLSDIAWKNDPARLVQIAGYPLDNRPSAVQFIEIFSNHIQRNYQEERILT